MFRRPHLAFGLSLLLLAAAPAWAGQRSGRAQTPKRPVVVDVSSRRASKMRALSDSDPALRRSRRPSVDVYANDEMRLAVDDSVAGREVRVKQAGEPDGHANALFRTLQAVEASRMGRAKSISVELDEGLSRRYGDEFVDELLIALDVSKVSRIGADGHVSVELPEHSGESRRARLSAPRVAGPLLWGGNSHPALLTALGRRLRQKPETVRLTEQDQKLEVQLPSDPAGRDVYLLQSKRVGSSEQFHSDMLDLLKVAWEAKHRGAGEITAIVPYLPYSRSDRADSPGVGVGAALLPKLMKQVGIDRVVFYSVHQPQELGIFQALNMQVIHASGESILAGRTASEMVKKGVAAEDLVVIAPDAGAEKRAKVFAGFLAESLGVSKIPTVVASKERNADGTLKSLRFDADISGKVAIAIDDETASGGTLNELAKAANRPDGTGARSFYAAVSHLTGPAYSKIDGSLIEKLFVLDTLPQEKTLAAGHPAIEVVSVADHLAKLVRGLQRNQPIDQRLLFFEHR